MFLPQVGTIHCQSWTWNSVLVFQLWVLRSEPAQLLSGKARRRGALVSQPHADAKQEGPLEHAGLEGGVWSGGVARGTVISRKEGVKKNCWVA